MFNRSSILKALCTLAIMISTTGIVADNGIIVSTYGKFNGVGGAIAPLQRGTIVKYTLTGTSVSGPVTLFDYTQGGLASYPVISLDGQHVAFWRWGVSQVKSGNNVTWVQRPGTLPNPNDLPDTNWLSVMDIDGKNIKNLLMVDIISVYANEYDDHPSALAWPSGDWIYYEKPTCSWEIWRVNYKNPLLNELVVKFTRKDTTMGNWSTGDNYKSNAPYFRRFTMSADARFAGGQLISYTNTSYYNFPPPGGEVSDPAAHLQSTGGCNTSMSVSGKQIAHYSGGDHSTTVFKTYNGIVGSENGSQVIQGHSEAIRWAANSDKWLCQCFALNGYSEGSNEVVRDVVAKQSIYPQGTSCNGWNNDAGQVWISGGPADSYQNQDGTWTHVNPVVPRDETAPSTPTNLHALAQSAHITTLTWGASSDAESGVFCYIVYRNTVQIGTSTALSFTDSSADPATQYTYEVAAINRGATLSAKATIQLAPRSDTQGAQILSIDADNGPTSIIVTFDEPLDLTSAQVAGNYTISGGTVSGASLSSDGRRVTLTTGKLVSGSSHTLAIHNVYDKATSPNASSATSTFTYRGLAHGLVYETYNTTCGWTEVPPLTGTPAKTGVVRNLDISNRGNSCAIRFKGYLSVPVSGTYEVKANLYYNALVTIDGVAAITLFNNFGGATKMMVIPLAAGLHPLIVDITAVGSSTTWAFMWYAGPGGVQHRVSDGMLYYSADGTPVGNAGEYHSTAGGGNKVAFRQTASHLEAKIKQPGHYALMMAAPNGAIVRSLRFERPALYRVPTADLAHGMYFIKIAVAGKTEVMPLLLK